jgi:hypothetical protein
MSGIGSAVSFGQDIASAASSNTTEGQVIGGVEAAGVVVGTVFPPAGAIIELAAQIASLFGQTHPEGHDAFIGLPANGAPPFFDNSNPPTGVDQTTLTVATDLVELLDQIFVSWMQQGAVLTNPPLVIEIRDDGSPGMLFHPQYVATMPQAEMVSKNMTQGLILVNGWNDRDSSQYWPLGPINNVQGLVEALYAVFQNQGWIKVIAAPMPSTDPTAPTTAQASSGTTVTAPPLIPTSISSALSASVAIGSTQIPVWLLLGGGLLLFTMSGSKRK